MALIAAGCGSDEEGGAVLIIESEPEDGATVIIGGRNYGETPARIRGLGAGQYYAILAQYGYKRKTQSITLPESGEVRVTAVMEPLVGYLSLTTNPPAARVYVEGVRYIGETPFKAVRLPVGSYTYEIRKENYVTLERKLDVQEDYHYSFTHRLTPMKGRLQVFSRPTGATVYINDEEQTVITPTRFQLAPDTYTVSVYLKGYVMMEEVVEIDPNGEHSVDLRLEEGEVPLGMLFVPAGEFIFGVSGGAPDEDPERKIDLDAFYIDKFEVTNRQFAEVFPGRISSTRMADYPVQGVTWSQASQYALAVRKRLPTEMEWEKAARGTDGREYPWGNNFDPKLTNIEKGLNTKIAKIGQYRGGASPYGVMDMAGNVYEWTSDWYQPYEGNTLVTVDYGQVFRVLRGGSYLSDPFDVRGPRRHYDRVERGREDYGFRCAMDIPEFKRRD